MDHGNWGFGALRNISREIKSMFAAHNIDVTTCPFAGGRMHVENFVMDLPHVPSGLSWFAAVSKLPVKVNFVKLRGAYWFGPAQPSVYRFVTLFFQKLSVLGS